MLVVMPAGADVTVHQSLLLAKQLDPEGRRTLGVITKCDRETPQVLFDRVKENAAGLQLGYALLR